MNRRSFLQVIAAVTGSTAITKTAPALPAAKTTPLASRPLLEMPQLIAVSPPSIETDLIEAGSAAGFSRFAPGPKRVGVMNLEFVGLPTPGMRDWFNSYPARKLQFMIDFRDGERALTLDVYPRSLTTKAPIGGQSGFTLGLEPTGSLGFIDLPHRWTRNVPYGNGLRMWIGSNHLTA